MRAATGNSVRICRELGGNLVWPMCLGERVLFSPITGGMGNLYSVRPDGSDMQQHATQLLVPVP